MRRPSTFGLVIRQNRFAMASVLWLLGVVIGAFGLSLLPIDPFEQNLIDRLLPPMSPSDTWLPHILGTDMLGRDVLARVLYGARISLVIAAASVLVAMLFGVAIGVVSGYFRGFLDDILGRLIDVMIGFPGILAAMFLLFVLGPGFVNIVIVMALLRWPVFARVSRGLVMGIGQLPFVEASALLGSGSVRIMVRHLVPNILSPILILATLEIAYVMLAEATLSFLGFGIQPPTPSWGVEIARAREYIRSAWWLITFPGLAIFLTTLSLNVIAGAMRSGAGVIADDDDLATSLVGGGGGDAEGSPQVA
ncbi:MAG: ABC transporter permease [Actinomycetota bacterium]